MSNGLVPYQDRSFVRPDMGPNRRQLLSTDEKNVYSLLYIQHTKFLNSSYFEVVLYYVANPKDRFSYDDPKMFSCRFSYSAAQSYSAMWSFCECLKISQHKRFRYLSHWWTVKEQASLHIWAMTCDFQQCGILIIVDSDKPVQPPFIRAFYMYKINRDFPARIHKVWMHAKALTKI